MLLTFYIHVIEILFFVDTKKTFILENMLMKDLNGAYFNQFSNKQGNKTHAYLT